MFSAWQTFDHSVHVQVDRVLQQHPGVTEAATFAVPEPMLGQVAQAAVVLQANDELHPKQAAQGLREFAKSRLDDHKASQAERKSNAGKCTASAVCVPAVHLLVVDQVLIAAVPHPYKQLHENQSGSIETC